MPKHDDDTDTRFATVVKSVAITAVVCGGLVAGWVKVDENARYDPFTGADGEALEQRVLASSKERHNAQQRQIDTLVRWKETHDPWSRQRESELHSEEKELRARLSALEYRVSQLEARLAGVLGYGTEGSFVQSAHESPHTQGYQGKAFRSTDDRSGRALREGPDPGPYGVHGRTVAGGFRSQLLGKGKKGAVT